MNTIQFHLFMYLLVLATLLGLAIGILLGFYFGYRRGEANTLRDFAKILDVPKGASITCISYNSKSRKL